MRCLFKSQFDPKKKKKFLLEKLYAYAKNLRTRHSRTIYRPYLLTKKYTTISQIKIANLQLQKHTSNGDKAPNTIHLHCSSQWSPCNWQPGLLNYYNYIETQHRHIDHLNIIISLKILNLQIPKPLFVRRSQWPTKVLNKIWLPGTLT